jgi:hypothetical protein
MSSEWDALPSHWVRHASAPDTPAASISLDGSNDAADPSQEPCRSEILGCDDLLSMEENEDDDLGQFLQDAFSFDVESSIDEWVQVACN